jgi:hypothetical protein
VPIIQPELFGDAGSLLATHSEGQPGVLRLVNGNPEHPAGISTRNRVTYQHGAAGGGSSSSSSTVGSTTEPQRTDQAPGVWRGRAAWVDPHGSRCALRPSALRIGYRHGGKADQPADQGRRSAARSRMSTPTWESV